MWKKPLLLTCFLLFYHALSPHAQASDLMLNEIMPKVGTGEKEWVEIYNNTNSDIDLTNWSIQEKTASTGNFVTYTISDKVLPSQSLCYYEFSSSKLNDTGDTVNLNFNDTIQDSYTYTDSAIDKTFSRIPDGGEWVTDSEPTKTLTSCNNLATTIPTPTPTPTPTTTSSPTPSSTPTPTATPTPSPSSSFTISNIPSQITTDQSFTAKVELTISGNPDTVYYLKGAFKKTGGTRYFGLTKKDGNWIEYGDDYSEQYQITTDHNSSWSGNLEIKPDIYDKDYKGSGDYIFKVGRLTASGSSPTWSNEAAIKLNTGQDEITIQTSGTSSAAPSIETSLDSSSAVLAAESEYVVSSDSSDITATSSEEATPVKVAGEKTNKPNYIVIIGSVLVFSGIGSITYLYFKNKVKF